MEILEIEKYIWRINYPLAVEIPVHPRPAKPHHNQEVDGGSKCCHDNKVGHSELLLYRVSEQY